MRARMNGRLEPRVLRRAAVTADHYAGEPWSAFRIPA